MGPIAQSRVRPARVVVHPPSLDQDLRLPNRAEHLSFQNLIPELAIERFHIAVLPLRAWGDVGRLGPDHPRTALAANSGPLSERMCSDTPRNRNRSERRSITPALRNRR